MKKLRLDVESVLVESFQVERSRHDRGTVHGQVTAVVSCYQTNCCTAQATCPDSGDTGACRCNTAQWTCQGQQTCWESCPTGYCC